MTEKVKLTEAQIRTAMKLIMLDEGPVEVFEMITDGQWEKLVDALPADWLAQQVEATEDAMGWSDFVEGYDIAADGSYPKGD